MADVRYYVSQQNGNDSNDGTSVAQAWKTLTKAMQSVPTPSAGDNIYVHIGAGTYREKVIPTNNGLSATEKIHYCGDPYSAYLINDIPGRVRITGCDADEYPTNGRILDWTGKTNIELWDVYVDGSNNEYACYNIPVSRRVHAAGVSGFYYGTQYNCTAFSGQYGFYNGTQYNCTAIGGSYGFNSGTQYNCKTLYESNNPENVPKSKHILPDISASTPKFNYLFGMDRYGYPHNVNIGAGSSMNLQEERLYAFTPSETGRSIGVQFRFVSLGASGNITVELQKYIIDTWVTQKSKTIAIADLTTEYNYFEWDTSANDGDNSLTTSASTWRFRITANEGATSSVLYGSNSTTPTVIGHFLPDSVPSDIEGKSLHGSVLQGALDVASLALDSTTYQTNAPSIKFEGHGEKIQKLPVIKNTAVTVKYQVRHDGVASGKEPQIRLQHKDITTQTATHSAGANTWEELSVSVTPTFDGVIDVVLTSRDHIKNAWFSDPSVS